MIKNNLIVKSNQVIEASYTLTTIEQRLILSAIAQVPKGEEISDDVLYPLTTKNLVKLGGDEKASHKEFKDAVNRLYERSIILRDGDESDSFRWIQEKVFKGSTIAFIRFSKPILPFLSNLKAEFTKYLESDIVGMSSPYSIRFYELIMQYRSIGHREISLEDLRWMFQLQNKYPVWADLKKRVIEQATKEINEHSPYNLTIEPKRTGRKITSIVLKFQDKKSLKKPKESTNNPLLEPQRNKDFVSPNIQTFSDALKQSEKAKESDLVHRASRITGLIMSNGLAARFKQGDESIMGMMKRIKEEITTHTVANQWENKLKEFGVIES
jgi:plasmid replication initiation protein